MSEFTVLVRPGQKVVVEEVEDLTGGDDRIPTDRTFVVKGGNDLKLAVSRSESGPQAKASVVTMCG